jgi:hypothetical protein
MRLILTDSELRAIQESPAALSALIDFHEQQAAAAEAAGYDEGYFDQRVAQLKRLRDEAQKRFEQ